MQTVVITGARAPVALHLARLFHAAGHRVVLADTFRRPLARATRSKQGYERLPAPVASLPAYVEAWTSIMARWRPDLVIPTCEEVFHLAAVRDVAGLAVPLFAPPLALLATVHDKHAFAAFGQGLGADPPRTTRLSSSADLVSLRERAGSLVLKPVWSRFGARTLVRPTPHQLAGIGPTPSDPWVAQAYLPGPEICATAIAVDGAVTAVQAYRPLWRAGLGAGVAFEPIQDAAARGFVEGFCARSAWTGQVAFDFRHDADGGLHAIECNPRPTSGMHFFSVADGLPNAFAGASRVEASGTRAMTLPLAMATYGLAQAVATGRLGTWWCDLRAMDDLAAWPADGRLLGAQLAALAEIAGLALRRGTGLRSAATDDIEWNGEPFRL